MNEILDLRRQVLVGHLTHDRMRDVKQHITARLDWGNEWVEEGPLLNGFTGIFFFKFFFYSSISKDHIRVAMFVFYVSGHLLFIGSTLPLVFKVDFLPSAQRLESILS